uniref:Ion_trans domain-containing protein n=1 Tax=Macrostomum lignano TaxID=282301 RepID=A0A1I8F4D2_9PLAT
RVGVMWAIFVVCRLAIINVVVVAQPQWIGDTEFESGGLGFFGLIRLLPAVPDWHQCCLRRSAGRFLATILNDAFRAATVMSGLAALLALTTIVLMILFFFVRTPEWACSPYSAASFIPAAGITPKFAPCAAPTRDKFNPGSCGIRWAFILAILSIFDSLVLAILAFVLGSRFAKLRPLATGTPGAGPMNGDKHSRPQSEVNSAYADDLYHNPATTPRVPLWSPQFWRRFHRHQLQHCGQVY